VTEPTLLVERQAQIATVTLNRPAAMNALSPQLVVQLADCWRELAADTAIRAVIVTGAGDRAFCAGADLKRFVPLCSGLRAPEDEWDRRVLEDPAILDVTLLRSFDLGKPLIAALQAPAVGGGFELVQAADLRVMARTAYVSLKEVKWGLFPAGGSTVLLPRQLPWAIAMELLITGREMTAEEALTHGLVNRVTTADEVLPLAQELASVVASLAPLAVQAIRRSAYLARSETIAGGMAKESELSRSIFKTRDAAEGLAAFAERRKPEYWGV